jgi:hypothetical protein
MVQKRPRVHLNVVPAILFGAPPIATIADLEPRRQQRESAIGIARATDRPAVIEAQVTVCRVAPMMKLLGAASAVTEPRECARQHYC